MLSVIIAGVNPSVVEIDRIDGIQNPLFGIVSHKYLTGLRIEDIRRMLNTLGRRMGMRIEEEAIQYIYNKYGGHPMLTRRVCSLLHQKLTDERVKRPSKVTKTMLEHDENWYNNELYFYCRHVISEIEEFYPDEYLMLEYLATGRRLDYSEFSNFHEYYTHLQSYGLIENAGLHTKILIPVIQMAVATENARRDGRQTLFYIVPKKERKTWLSRRIRAIITDLCNLQKAIEKSKLPSLYGVNNFPEADKFAQLNPVETETEFASFINICNKCFVESITLYGKSISKENYWEEISNHYPTMWESLKRIKVYRHDRVHLRLKDRVNEEVEQYLVKDIGTKDTSSVSDFWFILQQAVVDGLLVGLQSELSHVGS